MAVTFEQHLDLIAVLARLVSVSTRPDKDQLDDRPDGERIRRLVYFMKCKSLGAAQVCFYEYRELGPVSYEVLNAKRDALAWDVISTPLFGLGYKPGPRADEFTARLDDGSLAIIDGVVLTCRDADLGVLEMAASYDFLRRVCGLNEDRALARVLVRSRALEKYEEPARDLLQALALG